MIDARPSPPPRLYKYQALSGQTLTTLKARTLWFGRPSRLNDPFDCSVPYRLAPVTIQDCETLLATDRYLAKRLNHSHSVLDAARKPTEAFRHAVEKSGLNAFRQHAEESYSRRGVTCFSETPNDTLLWSHYGGGHSGICLEFDTSSPWLGRLHKVRYTDDIPVLNIVEVLTNEDADVLWALLTKASCWSYEKEWRAIHAEADIEYCYGIEALTGLYLGAALTAVEKDLVCHIVSGTPVQLYEMTRAESSFRLEARPVGYTPYRHPAEVGPNDDLKSTAAPKSVVE